MALERVFLIVFLFSVQCTILIAALSVTCDLDLPDEAIANLSRECRELAGQQRQLAIEEAKAFAEWYNELNKYEEKKDPGFVDIPEKQFELREKMAIAAEEYNCTGKKNEEFYKCLKERRDEMIKLIPED